MPKKRRRKPKKDVFDQGAEVRKLARERVGAPPSSRPIEPRKERQPKHKTPVEQGDEP